MSKKFPLRGAFDKQYFKRIQVLSKSASHHLYHICWSLSRKLCSKKSLLLTFQILGLLVSKLATDEKNPVLNRDNLTIPIQIQLSLETKKLFLNFFLQFSNLGEILDVLKPKMTLIAFVFPKLRIRKT